MKLKLISTIFVSLLLLLSVNSAKAFDIHDISGNYTVLANLNNGKLFSAPSIDATMATMFNGILELNIKAAFPTQRNEAGENVDTSILVGPFAGLNIVQLLASRPEVVIVEGVNLKAGAGVLFAVSNIKGMDMRDWKDVTFPGVSLGVSF